MLDQLEAMFEKYQTLKAVNPSAAIEVAKFTMDMIPQAISETSQRIEELGNSLVNASQFLDKVREIELQNAVMMKILKDRYTFMLAVSTYPYRCSMNNEQWDKIEKLFSQGIFGESVLEHLEK